MKGTSNSRDDNQITFSPHFYFNHEMKQLRHFFHLPILHSPEKDRDNVDKVGIHNFLLFFFSVQKTNIRLEQVLHYISLSNSLQPSYSRCFIILTDLLKIGWGVKSYNLNSLFPGASQYASIYSLNILVRIMERVLR